MRNGTIVYGALLLASSCLGGGTAWAQNEQASTESDKQRIERLEATVADLTRRLDEKDQKESARAQQQATASAEGAASPALAPAKSDHKLELYGFSQVDVIQDFKRVNPDWDATLRPSRIPTTKGQFGSDGKTLFSIRQSRLGVKANGQLAGKDYEAKFEFDLFGTGVDAGQTTFRIRHAYARWGPILAGQTNTLFMDGDLFPNVIDYWGPTGMVFVRNPQVRFTFVNNDRWMAAVALEHPSDDIDPGNVRLIDPELATNIRPHDNLPDFTAQVQYKGSWGHVMLAGIVRKVGFDTAGTANNKPSGSEMGWGVNAGAVVKASLATFRVSTVYGRGIATYMNDGGMDLAPKSALIAVPPTIPPQPLPINQLLSPEAVKLLGVSAYVDLQWSKEFSSALGYSFTKVNNTNFQEETAYHKGEYASGNLLWTPDPHFLTGGELLWGKRTDNNGNTGTDLRAQFSFKVSFSSNDIWGN